MIECPNHSGSFDCNPFCGICEGNQEYNPNDMVKCQAAECTEMLTKDTYVEELGFCVDCQNAYFNGELDYATLERIN